MKIHMKLVIRNVVKSKADEVYLAGAGYTFYHGYSYGIVGGKEEARKALLDCIALETDIEDGYIRLEIAGRNYLKPEMIGQLLEEPLFPEFLTAREFVKYFIDMNRKKIENPLEIEEYLKMVELEMVSEKKLIKEFTYEEKMRLQFLCFLITSPPVIIVNGIKNVSRLDFLRDMKNYIDKIKENSIVIMSLNDGTIAMCLCDELLTIEDGYIQGGV